MGPLTHRLLAHQLAFISMFTENCTPEKNPSQFDDDLIFAIRT